VPSYTKVCDQASERQFPRPNSRAQDFGFGNPPGQNKQRNHRRNYDFVFLQEENLGILPTYVLRMIPERNQKDLLTKHIWVDEKTFRIERI
jgi:outer membrane lipoprotein-sorting protein